MNNFQIDEFYENIQNCQIGKMYKSKKKECSEIYLVSLINGQISQSQNDLIQEFEALLHNHYPSFLNVCGFSTTSPYYIVNEYFSDLTLEKLLQSNQAGSKHEKWDYSHKYIITLGISLALNHLHTSGSFHGSLLPKYIFLDSNLYPKISDFSLSNIVRILKLNNIQDLDSPVSIYQDPAIPSSGELTIDLGQKADIFAFSIIAYILFTDELPFKDTPEEIDKIQRFKSGERPDIDSFTIPDPIKSLIKRCWDPDPNKRPKFNVIAAILFNDNTYKDEIFDQNEIHLYFQYFHERFIEDKELISKMTDSPSEKTPDQILGDQIFQQGNTYYEQHNFSKALEYYFEAEKKGSIDAVLSIGICYQEGLGVDQDLNKAVNYMLRAALKEHANAFWYLDQIWKYEGASVIDTREQIQYYTQIAEAGDSTAYRLIGFLYEDGIGVPKDYSIAIDYYYKSANLGNSKAFNTLGNLYCDGNGFPQNYTKAMEFYQKSTELGNPTAFNNIGYMYRWGYGVEQDYLKAYHYYLISAEKGSSISYNNIGILYENGYGIEQNYEKALEFYQKAAKRGHCDALNNIGDLYENGNGVAKNIETAIYYYQEAAYRGSSAGYYYIGYLYKTGTGVEQNDIQAKQYFIEAGKKGSGTALNALGSLYENISDYTKAMEYYLKAAAIGNLSALNNIGNLYENGQGVEQDYAKALEYYEKAAEKGNLYALNNIGFLYVNGDGVEKDINKAISYFQQAGDKGNSNGYYYIGKIYRDALNVEQNYEKAMEYFKKSGKLKNGIALYNVGLLYEKGNGVPVNLKKAEDYYDRAAFEGNEDALKALKKIHNR